MSTRPSATDPYYAERHGPFLARSFLPLALITLGVVFLLGNLVPEHSRGGLILLGLGAAFFIGRVTTARYGYAVPAGLLIALAAYVSLPFVHTDQPTSSGGWFFVLLGLGFALVYLIGLRPGAIWPLFPATVLFGLGLVLFGLSALAPLASLSWIVSFWPAALVLLGLWLLFRDHLPPLARRPVGTLGGLAVLVYGVLAAASSVAAGGALARTGLAPGFGPAPFADTVMLDQPLAAGQTLSINNASGATVVRASADTTSVHLVATRHFSVSGQGPDVHLTPAGDGLQLSSTDSSHGLFRGPSWVDYDVEVPTGASVRVESSSGHVDIDGVGGAVRATTSSGQLSISNVAGAVEAQASSGSLVLTNLAGEVRAQTSSGSIRATAIEHLRSAHSNSGAIQLDGVFTDAAEVQGSSGAVSITFEPGSAVSLRVQTGSGGISAAGLQLADVSQQRNSLSGTLGTPAADAQLRIQTTSGSVSLSH